MEDNNFTPEEVVQLIYNSENEGLDKKVLAIYIQQQKEIWVADCYDKQAELASQQLRDAEEISKNG